VSDRIAVLAHGRVEQLGAPAEIYRRPSTRFVADFIGEANLFPVAVEEAGPWGARVRLGALTLSVPGGAAPAAAATLVARPETIRIRAAAPAPRPDGRWGARFGRRPTSAPPRSTRSTRRASWP
jgi:ABC-type Fe3+/spermidine/putrescine transport system ATPase subunit